MLHMPLLDIMLTNIAIAFHMQQLCKTELASTLANVGCCCERKFILPAGVGTPSAHPIEAAASSRRRSIPTSGIAADMEAEELQAHSATLAEFAAITGASSEVAAHYLEACSFNLERAVDFYFNNPPDAGGAAAHSPRPDAHGAAADDEGFHVVEDDDPPAAHGAGRGVGNAWQPPARMQAAAAGPGHGQDDEDVDLTGLDEDEMLQRALAASLNQGAAAAAGSRPGAGARPSRVQEPIEADDDDEELPDADAELAELARLRNQALAAHREAAGLMEGMANVTRGMVQGRGLGEGLPSMFPGLSGAPWAPPGFSSGSGLGGRGSAGGAPPGHSAGAGPGRGFGGGSNPDLGDLELPEGVDARDVEEARMLEAAMLGIQYEGPMPDFSSRPARPSAPVDPAVRMARGLRHEQDQAYEESLAADRAKAEALAKAQADAERAERDAKHAAEAEARRLAEAEAALKATLERKRQALAAEPSASDANSVNVMIRLPDGSRKGRRFWRSDPVQMLFDFVDVQLQGEAHLPGSYSLVVSYPRKVIVDGTPGSLEDSGITADTALFLEPRTA